MAEFVPPSEHVKITRMSFYAEDVPAVGTRVLLSEDGKTVRIIIRRADNQVHWLDYNLEKREGIFYPTKEAFTKKGGITVRGKILGGKHVVEFKHRNEEFRIFISELLRYAESAQALGKIRKHRGIVGWLRRLFGR